MSGEAARPGRRSDGFFVAFSNVPSCIACAVAIQRGLERHRREHLLRHLPDPIDPERDAEALFRLGLSADTLADRMGGSP